MPGFCLLQLVLQIPDSAAQAGNTTGRAGVQARFQVFDLALNHRKTGGRGRHDPAVQRIHELNGGLQSIRGVDAALSLYDKSPLDPLTKLAASLKMRCIWVDLIKFLTGIGSQHIRQCL
ncbi:hypothetical protein D9M70_510890 [compost metagenome]